jgi:hypothetical protein
VPISARLLIAAAALGLGIVVWAARGGHGPEPAPRPRIAPAPAAPKARAPGPPPSAEAESRISVEAPVERPLPAPSGAVSPETAVIQERVRKMEERFRELEARRDALRVSNRDLEAQVAEKGAEASARAMAEWRVRAWESLLGLNETQKQSLLELWTRWGRQDAGRPADAATWLDREADLRSRLTTEQAARLSEQSAAAAQKMWTSLGPTLGSVAGGGKDEQSRLQQLLGDFRPAADMLLPEAHGADWSGLMHEATSRVKPSLTPEQTARLDRMGWK